jgi:hypothetical protein
MSEMNQKKSILLEPLTGVPSLSSPGYSCSELQSKIHKIKKYIMNI